jgi:DNA-binding MarR family transcriptional regulator/GNAT superfamily N-acetyltransferase
METSTDVDAVRSFNRFYTGILGLLRDGLLRTPYSLTEARVLFELAQKESTEVVDLRRSLGLDPGYLSRILARFETDGLVKRKPSSSDARRHVIRLTAGGRKIYEMLDRRSAEQVETMLSTLTDEEKRRLVGAMGAIQEILQEPHQALSYVIRNPRPGDFGWIVHRHGVLYAEEYGWDETFEALVARIVADYIDEHDSSREAVWIAEIDGEPVGCVFCVKKTKRTAQLRLLLVEPFARGMGIGARLVKECMDFARRAGYTEMTLWTNDVLHDARRVYERAGWKLVEENQHHSFGQDLVGQNWRVRL